MPKFSQFNVHQLDLILKKIYSHIYTELAPLNIKAWCSDEPLPFDERSKGKEKIFSIGDKWGNLFDCAWFHFTGVVPENTKGKKIVLLLDVNGEMCVFDSNGVPVRGLTTVNSVFAMPYGDTGKRVYQILEKADGGEKIDVWADAGCNDLFGTLQGNGTIKQAAVAICNDGVRALYYDFEVLLELMKILPKDKARYQKIYTALNNAATVLTQFNNDSVKAARSILSKELKKQNGDPSLRIHAVGHAHLDLAWLWPIRESLRKGARTFATALALLDKYPNYVYGASQAQLYVWMKNHYPRLFDKVKTKIKEGRIEILGASWVEFDANIPDGESIVRQILYGTQYFKNEFGVKIDHLWQPDVFGYNAALPQILKKSGIKYFMTQKLSWSLINRFPHHSFHWQGIDGSTVLTHMLPEETYNSSATPASIDKIEKNYQEKDVSDRALLVYGIGDGGGGPGAEHLERLTRMKNLDGISPVQQTTATEFFQQWSENAQKFPKWVGELYLERHQGTFTTNARNKWYNRKIEIALRELEWVSTLNMIFKKKEYPAKELNEIWQEVLLYQFHDILPGSSIKRVYDESLSRYRTIYNRLLKLLKDQYKTFANQLGSKNKSPAVAFNSLSWQRSDWIKINQTWCKVLTPPMGFAFIDSLKHSNHHEEMRASSNSLENDILKIQFNKDGSIKSIFDKKFNREIITGGCKANRLVVYHDEGDAWDIPLDYASRSPEYLKLISAKIETDRPKAILKHTYQYNHSRLVQRIVLTQGSRKIEFHNRLRWRETQTMLRTSFSVNIQAEKANYEIQFGHIERPTHQNTTWDLAKDEVPAQKWADISQRDYGVALLNDSKYGYKIKDNVIDLNLLRSAPYPGAKFVDDSEVKEEQPHHGYTDQNDHFFSYALYPHPGDHIEGKVIQAAYEFNVPLQVYQIRKNSEKDQSVDSFIKLSSEKVIVSSVKKAEDNDDVILRLYESTNSSLRTKMKFAFCLKKAEEVNLMEEPISSLPISSEKELELNFKPFEIKTIKVTAKRS